MIQSGALVLLPEDFLDVFKAVLLSNSFENGEKVLFSFRLNNLFPIPQ